MSGIAFRCGILAAAVLPASGQTAYEWALPVNGTWSTPGSWTPAGIPGAGSPLDTATLGNIGPYEVTFDVTRTIAGVSLTNPEASLRIQPFIAMFLEGDAVGPGVLNIGRSNNGGSATAALANGATLDVAMIQLNRINAASVQGPTNPGQRATIGPNATVQGIGFLDGLLDIAGTIHLRAGDQISLMLDDATLTGGGVLDFNGGEINFNASTLTSFTLMGDIDVDPNESVVIGSGVTFADDVSIGRASSNGAATMFLQDSVSIDDTTVTLLRQNAASVRGPAQAGERASIGQTTTIQGSGFLDGLLDIEGTILLRDGDRISLFQDDGTLTGGGVVDFAGGDIVWADYLVTDMTLRGDVLIGPSESFRLGAMVDFDGPLTIGSAGSTGAAILRVLDGITLDDVDVSLERFNVAAIQGPALPSERATIGPGATVSGSGFLDGLLDIQGTVRVDTGDAISLFMDDATLTGGGTIDMQGGDIAWRDYLLTDITVQGNITVDPNESVRIGQNVTFEDPIHVGQPGSTGAATVRIQDGVTLTSADVVLNRANVAAVTGPSGAGERATVGASSTVTGSGFFDGLLDIAGTVFVEPGDALALFFDDGLITGGGVFQLNGGDVAWRGLTATSITLRNTILIDPSESLVIGPNVTLDGTVTVGQSGSTGGATLFVADGVTLADADIVLTRTNVAELSGPIGPDAKATIGSRTTVRGVGFLDGNLDIDGTLLPGDTLAPAALDLFLDVPATFGPTAEVNIGFASDAPDGFGRLRNTGVIELGGTLRVRALNGFEPMSQNAIDIITGGTITGEFDNVIFEGNLRPEDVVRVFYLPDRVEFVVTCNADIAPPGGTLDLSDVDAFIAAFLAGAPDADLVPPMGIIDLSDLDAFITLFLGGCP
ncbi:MAG: GC-type dockerin domain-anchored protein [Planctomycetota bacterium]